MQVNINAGGDKAVLGSRIRQKTQEYNAFSKTCGIRAQMERVRVVGYDRSMSARVRTAMTPSSGESMIGGLNRFSALSGDLKERSRQVDMILDKYEFSHASKWSGTTNVLPKEKMSSAMGRKEWNCNITLRDDSSIKTTVHEHLHARSCSYFDPVVYANNKRIEEGAVELLAEEICRANGINYTETYQKWVSPLRSINSVAQIRETDFDFAKALIDVDLPSRYNWLRNAVDDYIATHTLSSDDLRALNISTNTMYGKE